MHNHDAFSYLKRISFDYNGREITLLITLAARQLRQPFQHDLDSLEVSQMLALTFTLISWQRGNGRK